MFKPNGFSLIELLVTIAILAIALSFALPSFEALVTEQRLRAATQELHGALNQARQEAVLTRRSISIAAADDNWARGWSLFVDSNNNGIREPAEPMLAVHDSLQGVAVYPDATSRQYIHYTPGGNSIQPSGAFHSGRLLLCARSPLAFRIVINKAGRIRQESGNAAQLCPH